MVSPLQGLFTPGMDPGRPGGELVSLMGMLQEALTLESKFQPHLDLPQTSDDASEITAGIRDGSAHVLRCLKVWYDLPSDVLFVAINLMDRFLTKMKVNTLPVCIFFFFIHAKRS